MRKLYTDSLYYVVGSVAIKALGLVLIPVYTKHFTIEEYGTLAILIIYLQLFSTILLLGVNSASTRLFFEDGADDRYQRKMYGAACGLMIVTTPILALLVAGPMGYLAKRVYQLSFFPLIAVVIAIAAVKPMERLATGLMRVRRKAKAYVSFQLSLFAVQFCCIYIGVVYLNLGIAGQLYGQLACAVIFFVVSSVLLLNNVDLNIDRDVTGELLAYGLPLVPFLLFAWLHVAAPRLLLERFATMRDVGLFALASQVSGLLLIVGTACDNALVPHYYDLASKGDASSKLGDLSTQVISFFALVGLVAVTFGDVVITLLADAKFHAAAVYVPCLVLAVLLQLIYKLIHWNLLFNKQTHLVSMLRGGGLVLFAILAVLLVKMLELGVWGIIYAIIGSELILIVVGLVISQKSMRVDYRYGRLALSAVAVLCGCGLVKYAQSFADVIGQAFIGVLFVGAVTLLLCRMLGTTVGANESYQSATT